MVLHLPWKNKIRAFWQIWIKFYYISSSFLSIPIYLFISPILIFYSISCRNKGDGYYIGLTDIANNLTYLKKYLNLKNIPCTDGRINNSAFYNTGIVKKISLYFRLLCCFVIALRQHDKFFFCWFPSFMPYNLDFIFLRLANKQVLRIHCGDDVRYRPLHNKIYLDNSISFKFPTNPFDTPIEGFSRKLYRQKWPRLWNVKILSCRETETFLNSKGVYQAFLIQESSSNLIKKDMDDPLIVHAPTNRYFKGTSTVEASIKILREQGIKFRFQLMENMDNDEVLTAMEDALIFLDQPGFACGRAAAEAFSRKCIVFNNEKNDFTGFNRVLPVQPFSENPQELAQSIKKILALDKLELLALQELSYKAWEDYYSMATAEQKLESILSDSEDSRLFPHENYKYSLIQNSENLFQQIILKMVL